MQVKMAFYNMSRMTNCVGVGTTNSVGRVLHHINFNLFNKCTNFLS